MAEQKTETQSAANEGTTALAVQKQENVEEIDLLEIFFALVHNWRALLLGTLIGAFVFGLVHVIFIKPAYQANTELYITSNDSMISLQDLQIGTAIAEDYRFIITSRSVLNKVIEDLQLDLDYDQLKKMITVTNPSNTRMLNISASSTDPELAANVANEFATVVSNYISDTMKTDKPSIMSVALVPTNPYNISRLKAMLIGAMLGFLIVAAAVTVIMLTDDRVKNAEDIYKYTGLTNLAIVPLNRGDDQPSVGKKVRV